MRRVLRLDDAEYEAVRARWQAHVGRLCRRDSEAAACRALLEQASEERVEAVGQYGYLTRVGEGTKIVFTGDPYQIDNPYVDIQSNML